MSASETGDTSLPPSGGVPPAIYYKGEEKEPRLERDGGIWWNLEKLSIEEGQRVTGHSLTEKMLTFLRWRIWDSSQFEPGATTWDECQRRALEMYLAGIWDVLYILEKDHTLKGRP